GLHGRSADGQGTCRRPAPRRRHPLPTTREVSASMTFPNSSPGLYPGLYPTVRPRRLRRTPAIRRLVAQTRLHAADLVLPMFVKESLTEPAPPTSMPGVLQHTRESLKAAAVAAVSAGVGGLMVFGIPPVPDAVGFQGPDPGGLPH